jgi:hypothetical protein
MNPNEVWGLVLIQQRRHDGDPLSDGLGRVAGYVKQTLNPRYRCVR